MFSQAKRYERIHFWPDIIYWAFFVGLFYAFTGSYAWIPRFWQFFWSLLAVVHLLFALGVAHDAAEQRTGGTRVYFVEPLVWGLATFIGGFFNGHRLLGLSLFNIAA